MSKDPKYIGPERVVIDHAKGRTTFSAMGVADMGKPFRQTYVRSDKADRSTQSHNHEFAEINEYFQNIPEVFTGRSWAASPETMRKHALIEKGWCDILQFYFSDKDHARQDSPLNKKTLVAHHGYVVGAGEEVEGGGFIVVYKVPKSQSKSAMGATAFQESKSDVLEWCEEMMQAADDLRVAGTS